jgi:hypothetical protein
MIPWLNTNKLSEQTRFESGFLSSRKKFFQNKLTNEKTDLNVDKKTPRKA